MFTVNGKELEYDIFDADMAELFELEMKAVTEKMDALSQKKDSLPLSQSIRIQCEAVAECFDNLFGAGTSVRIFDGKVNLLLALKCFEELIGGIQAQKEEVQKFARRVTLNRSDNSASLLSIVK